MKTSSTWLGCASMRGHAVAPREQITLLLTEHRFTPEHTLHASPDRGKCTLGFPVLTHHVAPHTSSSFLSFPRRLASQENSERHGLPLHVMKQEFAEDGKEGGISR